MRLTRLVPVQLKLLLLLLLSGQPCVDARTEDEASTQCSAKCISDFKLRASPILARYLRKYPQYIHSQCGDITDDRDASARRDCHICSLACTNIKSKNYTSCRKFCKKEMRVSNTACTRSCQFKKYLLSSNQGSCAPSTELLGSSIDIRCKYQKCDGGSDVKCNSTSKCCDTACGAVCMPAIIDVHALPPTPAAPHANKNSSDRNDTITLDWSPYDLSSAQQPIMFLVQVRTHVSKQLDAQGMQAASWRGLAISSRTEMALTKLKVGGWYQFRVLAVSVKGYREYSKPSAMLKNLEEPLPPPPVEQLLAGRQSIRNGAVRLSVSWQASNSSDLPIWGFQIQWVKLLEKESGTVSIVGAQTNAPAALKEYQIEKLKPNTYYKISVRAVAKYGQNHNKSSAWQRITVRTMNLPRPQLPPIEPDTEWDSWLQQQRQQQQQQQWRQQQQQQLENECICGQQPKIPVKIMEPFIQNGDLRVRISWPTHSFRYDAAQYTRSCTIAWQAEVCIESTEKRQRSSSVTIDMTSPQSYEIFELKELKFNCRYSLRLQGEDSSGQVTFTWRTCFCTGSCTDLKGASRKYCQPNKGTVMPQPPKNISVVIFKSNYQPEYQLQQWYYNARLTWVAPNPLPTLRNFRITWGPREPEDVHPSDYVNGLVPRMDVYKSDTRIVSKNSSSFEMRHLMGKTVYVVRIESITSVGVSTAYHFFFDTPGDWRRWPVQKYIDVAAAASALHAQLSPLYLSMLVLSHWLAV